MTCLKFQLHSEKMLELDQNLNFSTHFPMLHALPCQINRCLGTIKLVHDVVWLKAKRQIILGVMSPW